MNKQLTIGILGLGVVGTGVLEVLTKQANKIKQQTGVSLVVKKAFVRNQASKQAISQKYQLTLTEEIAEIINDEAIDIVIEVMGKIQPAKEFISAALKAKKHVVTANKDLMATHGSELQELALQNGCRLLYEAGVAGGIPILHALKENYLADEITEVCGIVNGTSNFMLTQIKEQAISYDEALKKAQELGFAESDPTNDVAGFDAAYKTTILADYAFGAKIPFEQVLVEGIEAVRLADIQLANRLGFEVKLIGQTKKTASGVFAQVRPMWVPLNHPFAVTRNEYNAVLVKSTGIGESLYYGPGAGAIPTATSVVSDLVTIAQGDLVESLTIGEVPNVTQNYTADYMYVLEVAQNPTAKTSLVQLLQALALDFTVVAQEAEFFVVAVTAVDFKTQKKIQTEFQKLQGQTQLYCWQKVTS
ncbi:MAG: homoserine dehydrogenase [Enterococcus sp.]